MNQVEKLLVGLEENSKMAHKEAQRLFSKIEEEEREEVKMLLQILQEIKFLKVSMGNLAKMVAEANK